MLNLDTKPDNVILTNSATCEVMLGDVETYIRQYGKYPPVHGTMCYHHPLFQHGDIAQLPASKINGFNIDAAGVAHTMYYVIFREECLAETELYVDVNRIFSDPRLSPRIVNVILELTSQQREPNPNMSDSDI